jgi:membrane associated rhomboid family serine protease
MEVTAVFTAAFLVFAGVAEAISQKDIRRRTPLLTLAVCGLLSILLLLQLRFPWLLVITERNAAQIFHGDWWRFVTAPFFQDGWIVGGGTNIVAMFFIGNLVEQIKSRKDWLLIIIVGTLMAEFVGLWWQPRGAGNSISTCSLAGYLITVRFRSPTPTVAKILRFIAGVCALLLLIAHDIHGIAGMTGILVGMLGLHRTPEDQPSFVDRS